MHNEEACKEEMRMLEEKVEKLENDLAHFREIIHQSDATIEEHKKDNDNLRQKL